jgi:hypothetical protein
MPDDRADTSLTVATEIIVHDADPPALTTDQGDQTMRKTTSTTRSRFAKAAGILAIAAIAGMAAAGGAEAKSKHHGFKGHKGHHGFQFKFYPRHAGYGHGYGRCFYRGWDGRIYRHRHCGRYGYRYDPYYGY